MLYDTDKIVNENSLVSVVSQYTELKKDGNEYRGICPLHNEKTPSFTILPEGKRYHCFGCGANGDVIDFISRKHGVSFQDACKHLGGELTLDKPVEKKAVAKVIDDVYAGLNIVNEEIDLKVGVRSPKIYNPKRKNDPDRKFCQLTPSAVHEYRRRDGSLIGYVVRVDTGKGKITPTVQMVEKGGRKSPCLIPFKIPRCLYGMETLKDDGVIYIVEGEKSADALRRILPDAQVITWPQGTQNVDKADWKSLPEGRKYILIPDADYHKDGNGDVLPFEAQVGYKAMSAVKDLLPSPEKAVILNTHNMGKIKCGWDVADGSFDADSFKSWVKDMLPKKKEEAVEIRIKEQEPKKPSYDDTYFKCLGFYGKSYYFYHKPTGQVWSFTAKEINKSQMIMLAPLDWWEATFPKGKSGVDWDAVLDCYLRIQEKIGVFDDTCIRGRGAWIDNGEPLLHLGDKIVSKGKVFPVDKFESKYIYRKGAPMSLKYGSFLPTEESSKFVDVCNMVRWTDKSSGSLLAGWIFSSLVCGGLPSRTHAYLTGESGAGKSWVLENIIRPSMGKIALNCVSTTTEAGIRTFLKNDIRPIIFNESEGETPEAKKRVQGVFELARMATDKDAAPILKGGGDGESFLCRSSFLFASVNKSTSKHADENRTVYFEVGGSPSNATKEEKEKDHANFLALKQAAFSLIDDDFAGSLLTRAVELLPVINKNMEILADFGAKATGFRRFATTNAAPIAGLHALLSEEVITEEEAADYFARLTNCDISTMPTEKQEEQCLDRLLFSEVRCEDSSKYTRTINFSEMVSIISGKDVIQGFDRNSLARQMKNRGVKFEDGYVYLSGKQDALPAKCFKDNMFEFSWKEALCRLEGVEKFKITHFSGAMKTSGVKIPLDKVC